MISLEERLEELQKLIVDAISHEDAAFLLKTICMIFEADHIQEFAVAQFVILEKLTKEEANQIRKNVAAGRLLL